MTIKTAMYRSQHAELVRLASRIPVEGALDELDANLALGRLKGVLAIHLKLEDSVLYPAMLAHASPGIRDKASKYQREMGDLSASFNAFYVRWTAPDAIRKDPPGFQREWKTILAALGARIAAEENDLYATVDAYVDVGVQTMSR